MEQQTCAFGKFVTGDVYSMTLGIRVCLLFQKVSLHNRSYLFKKKLLWLNQEKSLFCFYFFSTDYFFLISTDWFTCTFKLLKKIIVRSRQTAACGLDLISPIYQTNLEDISDLLQLWIK